MRSNLARARVTEKPKLAVDLLNELMGELASQSKFEGVFTPHINDLLTQLRDVMVIEIPQTCGAKISAIIDRMKRNAARLDDLENQIDDSSLDGIPDKENPEADEKWFEDARLRSLEDDFSPSKESKAAARSITTCDPQFLAGEPVMINGYQYVPAKEKEHG